MSEKIQVQNVKRTFIFSEDEYSQIENRELLLRGPHFEMEDGRILYAFYTNTYYWEEDSYIDSQINTPNT